MLNRRTFIQATTIPIISGAAGLLPTTARAKTAAEMEELLGVQPIYREDSFQITSEWSGTYNCKTNTVSAEGGHVVHRSSAIWKPIEQHPWLLGETVCWGDQHTKSGKHDSVEYRNLERRSKLECADHWAFFRTFGYWPYQASELGRPVRFSKLVWILSYEKGQYRSVTLPWDFEKLPTSREEWLRLTAADSLPTQDHRNRIKLADALP